MTTGANQNLAGIDLTQAFRPDGLTATKDFFEAGQLVQAGGGVYVRLKAAETIATGQVVTFDDDFEAVLANATHSNTSITNSSGGPFFGKQLAVAVCAVPDDCYAWFCIYGQVPVSVSATLSGTFAQMGTTTAGGVIEAAQAGHPEINGIVLSTANASTAGNYAAVVTFPTVGDNHT